MTIADKLLELSENNKKLDELNGRMAKTLSGDVEKPKRYLDYDLFWGYFQDSGSRYYYAYTFWNGCFSEKTFYPKYDIIFGERSHAMCFDHFFAPLAYSASNKIRFSLKQRLEECGVKLDTSRATNLTRVFSYAFYMTELPTIDARGVTSEKDPYVGYELMGLFAEMYLLETIEKLIVKEEIAPVSTFFRCYSLKNIVIEGTIGHSGFNLRHSTELSKASIESFIDALSTETSEQIIVFSKEAVDKAYETSEGANDGSTSEEWEQKKLTKSNWVFTLIPFAEA